jgi:hypothetical protein
MPGRQLMSLTQRVITSILQVFIWVYGHPNLKLTW